MGNMNDPVVCDTLRYYDDLNAQDKQDSMIYDEAVRLVTEETSSVLDRVYSDDSKYVEFEEAIRQIGIQFSTHATLKAADVIADILYQVSKEMATERYGK